MLLLLAATGRDPEAFRIEVESQAAMQVKADLALRSNPGHGTQIEVEVPRVAAQSAAAQIA